MQFQFIAGLLPSHAAFHVQPMDINCDVLNVFRGDPGPFEYTVQTGSETLNTDLDLRK